MARLDLAFVNRLSLVDEPEVGGARYLVTKRHAPDEDDEQHSTTADPAESGETRTNESEMDKSEVEELVEKRVEEQAEQITEAATKAATEAASEAATEAVEKALADDPEDAPEEEIELEYPSADEIAKAMHEYEGGEDPEVPEERRKEIEAVVKGMRSDGRKARAPYTGGEGGEGEGLTDSPVADAVDGGGN